MPPTALWTGSIVFGLVNVPVQVVPAVRSRDPNFHMLRRRDGCRLRRKMVCEADGAEVNAADTVSGFAISPDKYVTLEPEEIKALDAQRSSVLEITNFVALGDIDPVYYDRPYYVVPEEGAATAYALLARAMSEAQRVGVGKMIMRGHEYLTAVRPLGRGLCLQIMRDADEVRSLEEVVPLPEKVKLPQLQVDLARQLIEALTTTFQPEKYPDRRRQQLEAMIERKAKGKRVVLPPPAELEEGVYDLMAALEKSVAAAKKSARPAVKRGTQPRVRRRKSA